MGPFQENLEIGVEVRLEYKQLNIATGGAGRLRVP
jgi:hypothetical protein